MVSVERSPGPRGLNEAVSVGGDHLLRKARELDFSVSTSSRKATMLPQLAIFSCGTSASGKECSLTVLTLAP